MSKYGIVPTSSIDIKIADKVFSKEKFEREQKLKGEKFKEDSKKELFDYYKNVTDHTDIIDVISTMIAYNYTIPYTINSELLSSHPINSSLETWDREYLVTTPLRDLYTTESETRSFYQILLDKIPVEYRDRYTIHFCYRPASSYTTFDILMYNKWIYGYIDSYHLSNLFYYICFCGSCCCLDPCVMSSYNLVT